MFNLPNSKTEIAQDAVRLLVSAGATGVVAHAVDDHTDLDSDNPVVEIGCGAIGYYVGLKLKPVTDAAVQKTVNQLSKIKLRRNKNVEVPAES